MENWLDDLHAAQDEIRSCAYVLSDIAGALARLGVPAGDEIYYVSDRLRAASKKVSDAISDHITSEARESFNNIGRTFKALLERAS